MAAVFTSKHESATKATIATISHQKWQELARSPIIFFIFQKMSYSLFFLCFSQYFYLSNDLNPLNFHMLTHVSGACTDINKVTIASQYNSKNL